MATAGAEDLTYRTVDGVELLGRLYRPSSSGGSGPAPFVVDAHGGAWGSGDRLNNALIHQHLAANGIGVFALDFRPSDVVQYPGPVEDVNFGIRWFKANAAKLGADASAIGGLGSSSGAQQIGLNALHPANPRYAASESTLGEVDASLEFFVACWPILDPLARYRTVQANGNTRLVEATEAYFADEAAIAEGNPYLVLERGEASHLPPMLIIQGTEDENIEHNLADIFAALYTKSGGDIEVEKYQGQPHGFIGVDPDSGSSRAAIARIREFIMSAAR